MGKVYINIYFQNNLCHCNKTKSPPLRRGLLQSRLDCTLGKKRAEAGKREKNKPQGMLGRDKRERRPLPDFVRFSGRICSSVVLAKPDDDFDGSFNDLSIEG